MKQNTVVLSVVFAVLTSGGALFAENARDGIDRLMKSYYRNGQFNGTILVKKNKDILYERAFGLADRSWNIENTLDSKFLIGSVSKSYTALLVLILVDEGLIDLNATINAYIPQYGGPGKNRATIHQMLTHTSGIPNHGAIPDLSKKRVRWIYDSDQYLELVKETALKFEPGTGFEYSGIAYNLLAILCEKITHKSFKELLQQKIFTPLQMNDSSLNNNLDLDAKRAYGYEYHLLEGYKLPSYISMDHCKGSGGILSTVEDMAKFNEECFDAQTLASKSLYKKMFTPHVKDWQHYGYGWWIDTIDMNGSPKTLISHGGSTDGYKTYSTRIVEDRTDIIILENDYFRTDVGVKWCYDLTNDVIDILAGKEVKEPKRSIAKAVGLAIGRKGIDYALAQLAELKKDPEYAISAADYYYLATELDKKHGLKQESIKIFEEGLRDFPEDFRLSFYYAETLMGVSEKKAMDSYRNCIRLYAGNEKNKRFAEEYQKALKIVAEKPIKTHGKKANSIMENEMVNKVRLQKAVLILAIGFLFVGALPAQPASEGSSASYRCFIGSTAFMLGNLGSDPPSLYQLNIGYRITPKDVISLEAITWRYHAPLGIPYGSSWGDKSEDYPGSIREYGLGIVYQRFLWKGLYTSLQVMPLKRIYRDMDNKTIQKGFQLFSTLRIGFQIPLFKNRFFLEPSIAATFWPVSTNVPQGFAAKDAKWNKYFLFEPGLHFGINF